LLAERDDMELSYIQLHEAIVTFEKSIAILEGLLVESVIIACTHDDIYGTVHQQFALDVNHILTLRVERERMLNELTQGYE